MQKQIITSAIAFTLFGCGGGESGNSGNPTPPPVKNYTISFLGTQTVTATKATTDNCQLFEDIPERDEKIIAYRTQPTDLPRVQYEVFIHYADGSLRKHYRGSDLNTTQLQFAQNEIPNDGYLSFAIFEPLRPEANVTTFSKSVLPDSFAVYTEGNIATCLTGTNPQVKSVGGFIDPIISPPSPFYSGFNTVYQTLDNLTQQYKQNVTGTTEINFDSQVRPLLAMQYKTDSEGSKLKRPIGFKFTAFDNRGKRGAELKLDPVELQGSHWSIDSHLNIENAFLFVNGQQILSSANYAYLWQPLIINHETINSTFSYALSGSAPNSEVKKIGDDNYYLYLEGQEDPNGNPLYWGLQHVAQGTTNQGTSLRADKVLDPLPMANTPTLGSCLTHSTHQCLTINKGNLLPNDGIQRIFLSADSISDDEGSLRQVFYTPIKATVPMLKFDRSYTDNGLAQKTTSVSFVVSQSPEVREAFLYQHQELDPRKIKSSDVSIDAIPLLKNIAAQQDFQDKLKRHPYTWVWLKTDGS